MKKKTLLIVIASLVLSVNSFAGNDPDKNYIRNSVYMIKLNEECVDPDYEEAFKIMSATFDTINFASNYERYNDFSLNERQFDFAKLPEVTEEEMDAYGKETAVEQLVNDALRDIGIKNAKSEYEYVAKLMKYFEENKVAQQLVAKWHNKQGVPTTECQWDNDLYTIYELGLKGLSKEAYDNAVATDNLINLVYGAENKLLSNTYVCVVRYGYMSAEEVVAVGTALLKSKLDAAPAIARPLIEAGIDKYASKIKGYFVRANAYLFKLDWNEDCYKKFYDNYWENPGAFMDDKSFKLTYVGKSSKRAPAGLSLKSSTTLDKLIARATMRGTDAAFAALQRDHEEFRPMTSLHVIDGKLAAYIGMKEGIEVGDKFNVYEAVQSKTDPNMTEWKSIGTIKVAKGGVWDNRAGAGEHFEGESEDKTDDEKDISSLPYTIFTGKPGKMGEGCMIRLAK